MRLLDVELGPVSFTCLAVACAIVAGVAAVLLERPARRFGLVSRRRRDRFGAGRVPMTGGPGLAVALVVALVALHRWPGAGAAIAAGGYFLVGLADDLADLAPAPKLALQVAVAASATCALGAPLGLGLVLFVVLVNASNYLDNMDGLLAGVALTQSVALAQFSVRPAFGTPLLVCALPALLILGLPPARIYLGDSGSHLVGALLALDALGLLSDSEGLHPRFALPLLLVFAVPLADTATVTVSRLRRRRPVWRGGTDHLSHRLVRLGLPVPRAVLLLVLASGVCGVASLFLVHSS